MRRTKPFVGAIAIIATRAVLIVCTIASCSSDPPVPTYPTVDAGGDSNDFGDATIDGHRLPSRSPHSYVGQLVLEKPLLFLAHNHPIFVMLDYPVDGDVTLSMDGISLAHAPATVVASSGARNWSVRFSSPISFRSAECSDVEPRNTVTFEEFQFQQSDSVVKGHVKGTEYINGETPQNGTFLGTLHAEDDDRGPRSLIPGRGRTVVEPIGGAHWFSGRPLGANDVGLPTYAGVTAFTIDSATGVIGTHTTLEPGKLLSGVFNLIDVAGAKASPSYSVRVIDIDAELDDGSFETARIQAAGFSTDSPIAAIAGGRSLYNSGGDSGGTLLLSIAVPAVAAQMKFSYRLDVTGVTTTEYRLGVSAVSASRSEWYKIEDSSPGVTRTGSVSIAPEWRSGRILLELLPTVDAPCRGYASPGRAGFQIDDIRFE